MYYKAKEVDCEALSFRIESVEKVKRSEIHLEMMSGEDCPVGIKGFRGSDEEYYKRLNEVSEEDLVIFEKYAHDDEQMISYFKTDLSVEELEGLRLAGE